jgi:hypothetical protein
MMRSAMISRAVLAVSPFLFAQAAIAQGAGAEAKPAADTAAIADKVKADWANYDAGNKGHLTKDELGKWLGDLRTAAGQPAPDAAWQATAFSQTDSNADKKVSVDELTAFLASGK